MGLDAVYGIPSQKLALARARLGAAASSRVAPAPRIGSVERPDAAGRADAAKGVDGPSFKDLLDRVVKLDATAQTAANNYANAKTQSLHDTMIALDKADIGFTMLVSVRNKLLDAYREVMRMS
ncbi:MAG: flagellar hook-basal body complex protein FliE [Myxococcales bacterium]|nr:flagellar hook-basal body complex protein FliE [Myxococcales bacterium]